jgi:protocatechuate 3,4-dioxygenase beta subunit
VLAAPVSAQEDRGTATFKGKVLNASGSPLTGVAVRLYKDVGLQGSGGTEAKSIDFIPVPRLLMKSKLVRTVQTNDKGVFEIKNIKGGDYTYRIGNPMTIGYRFGAVSLEEGKTVEQDIKLDPPVRR